MTKTEKIDEGSTYEYLTLGFIIIIVGLACLALHGILTILFLVLGIGVIAISTGIEIDVEHRKIRKYKRLLGFTFGNWMDLRQYLIAELKFNSQYAKARSQPLVLFQPLLGTKEVKTAKTYDLILTNDMEEKKLFNSFVKVGLALKAIKTLEKMRGLEVINHVDNWVEHRLKTRKR